MSEVFQPSFSHFTPAARAEEFAAGLIDSLAWGGRGGTVVKVDVRDGKSCQERTLSTQGHLPWWRYSYTLSLLLDKFAVGQIWMDEFTYRSDFPLSRNALLWKAIISDLTKKRALLLDPGFRPVVLRWTHSFWHWQTVGKEDKMIATNIFEVGLNNH